MCNNNHNRRILHLKLNIQHTRKKKKKNQLVGRQTIVLSGIKQSHAHMHTNQILYPNQNNTMIPLRKIFFN